MKLTNLVLAIILTFVLSANGQTDTTHTPTIGLVLSGGAAHGLAHIGVIRALEELNIPINYISGTSMGAIVGALKSMGYSSDEIEDVALSMDWDKIINNKRKLSSCSKNIKYYHDKYPVKVIWTKNGLGLPLGIRESHFLDMTLRRMFLPSYKIYCFQDLPIPFQCFTTDIVSGKVHTKDSGNLFDAVRASMAIPVLFPPVRTGKEIFVDGGIERNFPVDDTKEMGADILIGSYVGAAKKSYNEINTMRDMVVQSSFLLSIKDYEKQKKNTTVLIEPDVKESSSLNFDLDKFNIEQGYKDAMKYKEELIQLRDSLGLTVKQTSKLDRIDSIYIDTIILRGKETKGLYDFVIRKLDFYDKTMVTLTDIEKGINAIYATSYFDHVAYSLKNENQTNALVITLNISRSTTVGVNINRFRTTGPSAIAQLYSKNTIGKFTDLRLTGRFSDYPAANLNLFKRIDLLGYKSLLFGLNTTLEYSQLEYFIKRNRVKSFDHQEFVVEPSLNWDFGDNYVFSIEYLLNRSSLKNKIIDSLDFKTFIFHTHGISFNFNINTFDREILPRKGFYLNVAVASIFSVDAHLGGIYNSSVAPVLKNKFETSENYVSFNVDLKHAFPLSTRFGMMYGTRIRLKTNTHLLDNIKVGGTNQLKRDRQSFLGLREAEVHLSDLVYLMYEINYSFYDMQLALVINGVGGSQATTNYIAQHDFIYTRTAAGLSFRFNSGIGPLQADLGWTSIDEAPTFSWSLGYRHIF